jgi:HAE1 family hydrophobic/amphiphilic exporter-1
MSISRLAIRRPVFAWMVMIGLILFGTITFTRLGIGYLPDVDFPVLTVSALWEGAAPEVLESEIVDRIEQAVISVEGLTEVTSSIRQGQATVTLEFELNRSIDAALQEVQSAISRIRLPNDVDPPTLRKSNPEDQPLLWLGIYSPERSLRDIIQYVEQNLKDQFEILPGVGEIILGGYAERNLRVWVNNTKLKERELTILDVRDAIERGHIETAAGIIENSQQEINVRVLGEALTTVQLADIVITTRGGRPIFGSPIRIGDIATVEDGLADIRKLSRVNGVPGIGLGIKKQRGANSVDVAHIVKKRMLELQQVLPSDVKMLVNFDSTVFIEEAIKESRFTLLVSVAITALVCFLFLGSFGPTFNILLSIPTSIVGTITFIYFLGFTLNLFTILALTLAIGIVVDDAIMVLENIYRHRAMGKASGDAAGDGGDEISFAALAATIAVIAIFLPIAFMDGVIGKFFFQFGCTLSIAVGLSLLEALTITPVRCAQFMGDLDNPGWLARLLNRFFTGLASTYKQTLRFSLRFRWLTLILSVIIFISSLTLMPSLRKELIPAQDQSVFIVRFESPPGTSLAAMVEKMARAESYFQSLPEVVRVFTSIGGFGGGEVNTGIEFISLKPIGERSKSQQTLMNEARTHFSNSKDVKAFIQDLSTRGFTAQRGFPLEFNIRGPEWKILEEKSFEITKLLQATGLVTDINSDYKLGQPELDLIPNRTKATELAVSIQSINDTIATAIGGVRVGKYTQDGRRYDLRVRLKTDQRDQGSDISALAVRNIHGELFPLQQLVDAKEIATLQTITRRNRERSVTVYGNLTPGSSQALALNQAQEISQKVLPAGYRFAFSGGSQAFAKSFQGLAFVLWLGVIVAYMVLASQFNSFWDPVLVLLALPFSITGAFLGLYLFDLSLNLYSVIGIILLMGIVKKNSIMLVEFANHVKEIDSLSRMQAILEAAPIRLRPILMTSIATIAAALPPALALGPGAESRIPMAVAIVGGVLVSSFLTLFVVPCAYSFGFKLK